MRAAFQLFMGCWCTVGGSTPPYNPPPPQGVKHLLVQNCAGSPDFETWDLPRPISLWARDLTAGGDYVREGTANTSWNGSTCSGNTLSYAPEVAGHVYTVLAVDYTFPDCGASDDPHGPCVRAYSAPSPLIQPAAST